jgi:hypothetical protein
MRQHGATHSSSSSSSSSHGRARKPQHDVAVTRPDYKQQQLQAVHMLQYRRTVLHL